MPRAPLQRVDRVLHQRLQRPLEQHRVAHHHRPHAGRFQPELDGVRALGQPRPEVAAPPGRPARRARPARAWPGLPMRSKRWATRSSRSASAARCSARSGGGVGRERTRSIQPCRLVSGVPIWCAASRAIATQSRSRCADDGAAVGEHRHGHHHRDGEALQDRERREVPLGRQRAVVHGADRRVHDRRVPAVEPGRVRPHARVVERRLEREVGGRGHPPGRVGHHQRQPQRPHLRAEPQQRLGLGARPRIVEPAEHAGVEPAGGGRVGPEVAEDQEARCRGSGRRAGPRAPPPSVGARRCSRSLRTRDQAVDAEVRHQCLRHPHRPVGRLVVLQEGDDRAGKRDARGVERVHELGLGLGLGPVADVGAAGLEIGERARARRLEPGPDAGGPDLEVEGARAGEARCRRRPARRTRYGSSSRCSTASACPVSRSCSAAESSGRQKRTSSTLSNWCTRMSPRVSLPCAPASRRKHGRPRAVAARQIGAPRGSRPGGCW